MVIGFDGSRAFAKDKTGTENYSFQLLKSLSKIDQTNTYIIFLRPGVNIKASEWPSNFQFKVLEYPRLWTQVGLSLETFKTALDVLFIPAHTLPIIRKPGLKTVITVHDLGAEYLPHMHQLKQRLYLSWMTQRQLKTATKIIAVSNATKEDIVKRAGISPKNIEVIYEGVNKEVFKSVKTDVQDSILSKYDLEKGKYFLFVGTIQPRKNLARLIEAFAKFSTRGDSEEGPGAVPATLNSGESEDGRRDTGEAGPGVGNTKLILVGGKGWLSDDIYQLPKQLGIEDRVKFLGRVDDQDLVGLYSGATALTFPSLFEGFGLPILEAFACKCPVLTSNTSSMPEVVGNSAILIDPYDIDSISNGLKRVQGTGVREQLITKGLKQLQKFDWDKAAKETLTVLEETANN